MPKDLRVLHASVRITIRSRRDRKGPLGVLRLPSQTDLEPVTLSWTPEVADIRQAGKVLRATRPKRYLWDIICGVLGAFVLICFQSDAGQWVPWALLTLLMTIMSARITATAMRYSLWRQSPANGVPIEGTIDPQTGITLRSATTVIVPWDSIKRLHETERVVRPLRSRATPTWPSSWWPNAAYPRAGTSTNCVSCSTNP